MQQREQDANRLLLVPRKHHRQRQVVRATAERVGQRYRNLHKRLMSYFSECIKRAGSYSFSIQYSRQQLADYLNIERSALSNELSLMQKDGLILYSKNQFTVHERAEHLE